MEGFVDNGGGFLPKEIAVVCLTGGYSDHWILDQPYLESKLSDVARIENKWLTQSTHGLEWKQGDVPYTWVFARLRQLSLTADRVYLYGSDRRKFLENSMNCDLIDLDGIIPPLRELPPTNRHCIQHGVKLKGKYPCAVDNAHRLKNYVLNCWRMLKTSEDRRRLTEEEDSNVKILDGSEKLREILERMCRRRVRDTLGNGWKRREPRVSGGQQSVGSRLGWLRTLFFLIVMISRLTGTRGLIGFDCGSSQLNITTQSLLEVGECDIPQRGATSFAKIYSITTN